MALILKFQHTGLDISEDLITWHKSLSIKEKQIVIWAILHKSEKPFTFQELLSHKLMYKSDLPMTLSKLRVKGFLEKVSTDRAVSVYQLTDWFKRTCGLYSEEDL